MEQDNHRSTELPTPEEQIEFFDKWNVNHRSVDFDNVDIKVRTRANEILNWLDTLKRFNLDILEIGCGTGWLTDKLTRYGSVLAIDLSPAAIAVAQSRNSDARFVAGNFAKHDFGGARFDVIICVETLFYVEDQETLLVKSRHLLRRDGWFAATAINKFVYDRCSFIGDTEKGQIRNWQSKRALRDLLSSYFELLSFYTVLPEGDQGVLRIVNSHKLNNLLSVLLSKESLTTMKEFIGLGGGLVAIARK